MASFAKIGLNNKVMEVIAIDNKVLLDSNNIEKEELGIQFLTQLTYWPIWKQTSYNTRGGQHILSGTAFRKNHPGIGYTYDEDRNAFIPPKSTFNSWVLNEDTCQWEAPVAMPNDDKFYNWNEETTSWVVN